MSDIYIAGISMTVFGRHFERSLDDLAGEALDGALKGTVTSSKGNPSSSSSQSTRTERVRGA